LGVEYLAEGRAREVSFWGVEDRSSEQVGGLDAELDRSLTRKRR
jgi:hypothetical protein